MYQRSVCAIVRTNGDMQFKNGSGSILTKGIIKNEQIFAGFDDEIFQETGFLFSSASSAVRLINTICDRFSALKLILRGLSKPFSALVRSCRAETFIFAENQS